MQLNFSLKSLTLRDIAKKACIYWINLRQSWDTFPGGGRFSLQNLYKIVRSYLAKIYKSLSPYINLVLVKNYYTHENRGKGGSSAVSQTAPKTMLQDPAKARTV